MFGFKQKRPALSAAEQLLQSLPEREEETAAEQPAPSPVPAPVELPLEGVAPDPPEEPEEAASAAPMLDFSAPPPADDKDEGSTSLADLFGGNEEETESSLATILERAPQATITEVMSDLEDIKEMLRGRLEKQ